MNVDTIFPVWGCFIQYEVDRVWKEIVMTDWHYIRHYGLTISKLFSSIFLVFCFYVSMAFGCVKAYVPLLAIFCYQPLGNAPFVPLPKDVNLLKPSWMRLNVDRTDLFVDNLNKQWHSNRTYLSKFSSLDFPHPEKVLSLAIFRSFLGLSNFWGFFELWPFSWVYPFARVVPVRKRLSVHRFHGCTLSPWR